MGRRAPVLVLVISLLALVGAGCFQSTESEPTVTLPVTIGTGTQTTVIEPNSAATATGATTTAATTTAAAAGNAAAGKPIFISTCGGCHTLAAAGTKGTVGPDLDKCAKQSSPGGTCPVEPFTAANVTKQIEHPVAAMPPNLVSGTDLANVVAYVVSVAGK